MRLIATTLLAVLLGCGSAAASDSVALKPQATVEAGPVKLAAVADISGQQADVFALASLIQKVCRSALPFGFEWAAVSTKLRPGELGGGYLVVTETDVLGGSTHWLMAETMQTLRAKSDVTSAI